MSDEQPCLGVCFTDPESGICLGCGRTPEEISGNAAEPDGAPACDVSCKATAALHAQSDTDHSTAKQAPDSEPEAPLNTTQGGDGGQ